MKRCYINPGHSDKDPGAVGYETERDLNVRTAKFMDAHLRDHYTVETKVTDGSINDTRTVCKEANAWKADLFVSIHNNAGGGDGWEGLVYSAKRKALGQLFEKRVKAAGQNSRGVKYRPGLNVLALTDMPAILCEGAFVDNKQDIADWNDDTELEKLGIAYAEAAAEALKLEKKEIPAAPAATEGGLPLLQPGDRGAPVRSLQLLLNGWGYPCGEADGVFGLRTRAALEAYQKAQALTPLGICREQTWRRIIGEK